jgi:hypothetical protein
VSESTTSVCMEGTRKNAKKKCRDGRQSCRDWSRVLPDYELRAEALPRYGWHMCRVHPLCHNNIQLHMKIHFTGYRIMLLFDYLNKSDVGPPIFRLDNDALFNSILVPFLFHQSNKSIICIKPICNKINRLCNLS